MNNLIGGQMVGMKEWNNVRCLSYV